MASRSARAAGADRRRSHPARAQGGRPETRVSFLRVRMRPNVDLGRQHPDISPSDYQDDPAKGSALN